MCSRPPSLEQHIWQRDEALRLITWYNNIMNNTLRHVKFRSSMCCFGGQATNLLPSLLRVYRTNSNKIRAHIIQQHRKQLISFPYNDNFTTHYDILRHRFVTHSRPPTPRTSLSRFRSPPPSPPTTTHPASMTLLLPTASTLMTQGIARKGEGGGGVSGGTAVRGQGGKRGMMY